MIRKAEYYRASGKLSNKKWRRYALTFLTIFGIAISLQFILRQLFFYPLKITSDSMAPEIQSGDKRYFIHPKLTSIVLGDIVLVLSRDSKVEFLCRVAALDGDKVRINEGQFIVNGQVRRTFTSISPIAENRSYRMIETEVRPNYFFCLNDNYLNTNDSRIHGIFERGQIISKIFRPMFFF